MAALSTDTLSEVTRAIDLAGVFANAVLGGALAARERLDVVGLVTLAVISGTGGGLIRDTLLQRGTPVALTDYAYLLTALAGAGVAFLIKVEGSAWRRPLLFVDALALGFWAVAGAQKTLESGLGWLPAVLLGLITAVGGGVVRDVLIRRVPAIFGGTLYAAAALAASVVVVVSTRLGQPTLGVAAGVLVGAGLRLLSIQFHWTLPQGRNWTLRDGREWWARSSPLLRPTRGQQQRARRWESWRASRLSRRGGRDHPKP
ncbi:hypothetical protein Athai_20710 [Actinocatenispora thailandica]|uniref:Glycine transporter domain-containing protein n=1 Tax=Actinocatenispora thailandica TaxID=227318 RepID=A0A7R7HWY1_9ACTN|nr:trimeric intracellular cation channel family protein [Actinocatenispora thailandica]BCJ34568.1 hypothetical protein Athai_20710 [Actinocatenispora thailandica]